MVELQIFYPPNSQSSKAVINTSEIYDDGFLRVEHSNYHVTCGSELVKLGRTEFLIISLLAQNANRFTKGSDIWNYVWQGEKSYNQESLKVSIYNLRRHFLPFGITIETMAKVGYKLVSSCTQSRKT
jgi:DNA-binding winged helix-turn-helix (wHTH) protein